MKKIALAVIALSITMATMAQTDTTTKDRSDTIKIGGMIIIKKPGTDGDDKNDPEIKIKNTKSKKYSRVSTNWFVFDVGFSNWNDNTNYQNAVSSGFVGAGVDKERMELQTRKSVNVNIWLFMQRINLISRVVNLKYGIGVELNNYRFENENLLFQKNPTKIVLNTTPANAPVVEKNKLAADYVTVPLMLNFNFTPGRRQTFGFSAGISGGYLYSARQKLKFSDDNKDKTKDDFDINTFKLSYIGELSLGPVRLYGSMATKSMWDQHLDLTPYNLGIRFSKF
ncbi:MAG TPA: outer membrane beta-barrel protein [Flavisolibacter sp.]|nr:outer membrane beta-barrel protein [Flavisolibacter sp.]